MEAYIRKKKTIRLRKIDIKTWHSAVARQFKIRSIPALRLYDGTDLLSDDRDEIIEILNQ